MTNYLPWSHQENYLPWLHQETKNKPKKHIMTIEEYKAQPFKDSTVGDYWYTFGRRTRREIERLVKKGKNPDIMKYV